MNRERGQGTNSDFEFLRLSLYCHARDQTEPVPGS